MGRVGSTWGPEVFSSSFFFQTLGPSPIWYLGFFNFFSHSQNNFSASLSPKTIHFTLYSSSLSTLTLTAALPPFIMVAFYIDWQPQQNTNDNSSRTWMAAAALGHERRQRQQDPKGSGGSGSGSSKTLIAVVGAGHRRRTKQSRSWWRSARQRPPGSRLVVSLSSPFCHSDSYFFFV